MYADHKRKKEVEKKKYVIACKRKCTWGTSVTNSLLLTKVKSFNINDEIKSTDALCRQHHMHLQSTFCHQIRHTAIYRLLFFFALSFHSILLRPSQLYMCSVHHHQLTPIVDRSAFFPFLWNSKFTYRPTDMDCVRNISVANWKFESGHAVATRLNIEQNHWNILERRRSIRRRNCYQIQQTLTEELITTYTYTNSPRKLVARKMKKKKNNNKNNYFEWPQCVRFVHCSFVSIST